MDKDTEKKKTKKSAGKSIKKKSTSKSSKTTHRSTLKLLQDTYKQEEEKKQKEKKAKTEKKTEEPKKEKKPRVQRQKGFKQKRNCPDVLNQQQKLFCIYYAETSNGQQSAIRAGYKETTACKQASRLLTLEKVKKEIDRLNAKKEEHAIATAADVMKFLTKVMNGEIKDQFGLDATLADRIKAGQELAKRTVDIDNRVKGVPDNVMTIKLDWRKSNGETE